MPIRETDLNRDIRRAYRYAKRTGTMTPHLRIMEASRLGRGVRLTPEEVDALAFDDAIQTAALDTRGDEPPPWSTEEPTP